MKKILLIALIFITSISAADKFALSSKLAPGGNYRTFTISVKPTKIGNKTVCAYTGRIVRDANKDGTCDVVTLHHLSRVFPHKGKHGWDGLYCGYDYTTDGPLLNTNVLRKNCPDILVMNKMRIIDTIYYKSSDNIYDYYADGEDPIYPEFYYNQTILSEFPAYSIQINFMERAGLLRKTFAN